MIVEDDGYETGGKKHVLLKPKTTATKESRKVLIWAHIHELFFILSLSLFSEHMWVFL